MLHWYSGSNVCVCLPACLPACLSASRPLSSCARVPYWRVYITVRQVVVVNEKETGFMCWRLQHPVHNYCSVNKLRLFSPPLCQERGPEKNTSLFTSGIHFLTSLFTFRERLLTFLDLMQLLFLRQYFSLSASYRKSSYTAAPYIPSAIGVCVSILPLSISFCSSIVVTPFYTLPPE